MCYMKVLRKFMFAAIAALPVVLCSCPEDCTEHEPKGYVVRMDNDYTDKVMATINVSNHGDTSYCCVSTGNHTIKIIADYYLINSALYDDIAYTSIQSTEWKETLLDSLSMYVIDTNPFDEVYAYFKRSYRIDELRKIIKNNELNKFERLK